MRMVGNIGAILLLLVSTAIAQSVPDYLILQDIGDYKFKTQTKDFITGQTRTVPGYSSRIAPGILAGADHFDVDHDDSTFETKYVNRTVGLGIDVQVTQHVGADSDTWLLHEVEDGYRDDDKLNASLDTNVQMRTIDNNNIYFIGIYGAKSYAWITSSNVVVYITCSNCPNTKPEPLEIVKAYLTKFPSAITLTNSDLKSQTHSVQWIKDEMDRRLWLSDKWVLQIQTADPKLYEKLKTIVDNMTVFLNYREKYWSIASTNDNKILKDYLGKKNDSSIKTKLAEYKTWWSAHKSDAITIP